MAEMMKKEKHAVSRTAVYAAVLIVLVSVFVIQETVSRSKNTITVPAIGDTVTGIQIETADGKLVLQGGPDNWTVGEKNYPADRQLVDDLIGTIGALGDVDTISSRGQYSDFGLDEEHQRSLLISYGKDETLALSIGNSAATGNALYARINGSREIVLLPASLEKRLSVDPSTFRDHLMFEAPEEAVDNLTISAPGTKPLTLQRKESDNGDQSWDAVSQGEVDSSVAEGDIDGLFQEIEALRADGFVESKPESGVFASVDISFSDGSGKTITLWRSDDGKEYTVEVSGNPYLFTLSEWSVRRLLLKRDVYFG